ncbi:hypothetical protein J2W22_000620 [Sphingomonas kyeonggiensis]|nr:hypothetical protein [Sphingomonas kyeonggiensis]
MADQLGTCCICGNIGKLSFEHVPPKRAFNDRPIFNADIHAVLSAKSYDEMTGVRRSRSPKGAGRHTLCIPCNNNTGSWYGPSYIDWVQQGARNLELTVQGRPSQPFTIQPLAVIKMIMTMFSSVCGQDLFAGEPWLRKFVLDKSAKGLPKTIVPLGYLLSERSTAFRQSGVSGTISTTNNDMSVFSELAFFPLGYILSLGGNKLPDERPVSLSSFAGYDFGETAELHIPLPKLEVNSILPADFRSDEQMRSAFSTNSLVPTEDRGPRHPE